MTKNPKKYLEALDIHDLKQTLITYNPWWRTKSFSVYGVPDFKRDTFVQAMLSHCNKSWIGPFDQWTATGQLWTMSMAAERSVFIDQQFVERVTLEDLRIKI